MPKLRQRITNELTNNQLFLNREIPDIQPDVTSQESLQVGELKEDHSSGQVIIEPDVHPVELVCVDDSRTSDTEKLVNEIDFEDNLNCMVTWDKLNNKMKAILPCTSRNGSTIYTYVIEKYEDLTQEAFSGAAEECFNAEFRVNLCSEEDFNHWLAAFSESSQCTYRKTRTYNPSLKRVLFKLDMHCHHYRKQLTAKQLSAKSKKPIAKQTIVSGLRDKKTNCPSRISVTLFVTNNKATTSLQCSHPTYIKFLFKHDHPIKSAHTLSFKPVSQETKDAYNKLFAMGHSAATARHYHESQLLEDPDATQAMLADRSINPNPQDVSRMYEAWRKSELGLHNGKCMFEKLEEEIRSYKEKYSSVGGRATLQIFDSMKSIDDGGTSDCGDSGEPPIKRKCTIQPMIVTVCTPMMARAHQYLPQAAKVIYCDSTSSLDHFNTSVFLLSTNHAGGSIPLGIALTSDEKESTLHSAL